MSQRNKWHKAKARNNPAHWQKYMDFRNEVVGDIRNVKNIIINKNKSPKIIDETVPP